ncbi:MULTISPECIES: DNA-binding protein [unclassified Microbacterium]|uniref:DNA-binding protein n=1 Tax=unclassified Microbacterium TaxID=2609290 RepID=UPI000493A17A|nr:MULTISPECIES: DNA-binding protein [unclassified Microbacterium]
MASVADKFMAEFAGMVADQVIRKLNGDVTTAPTGSAGSVDRLLTPDEAAYIFRAKKNNLAVWRMTPGAGPEFVKHGRLVFYTREAIQAYIDRNASRQ